MVRHDDEFVQRHVRVLGPQPLPGLGHQSACIVQAHIAIHYLTEQTRPSLDNPRSQSKRPPAHSRTPLGGSTGVDEGILTLV